MLRFVLFDTTYFSPEDDVDATRKDLMWLLEALTQRNQNYLAHHPNAPRLYKSGVKYEVPAQFNGECEEVRVLRSALGKVANRRDVAATLSLIQDVFGGERFRDYGRVLENGGGDCDNLACIRVAELRQAGIKAKPFMTHRKRLGGGTTYHALVRWPPIPGVPYETTEDPSLLLGMGGEAKKKEREEEIRKNIERRDHLLAARNGRVDMSVDLLEDVLGLKRPQADLNYVLDDVLKRIAA